MNWKLTLVMLSTVLAIMLGAGGASAYISYLMGREALKVVTQPDTDSENSIDRKKPMGGSHKGLKIIDEKSVLINVYNRKLEEEGSVGYKTAKVTPSNVTPQESVIQPDKFPITDKAGGVTLKITGAKTQGNSAILDVKLQNESPEAIRFLYSFLDVRDNQDRPLSAIADGLPGELPPNSKEYSGQFIIPATLLNNSPTISLSLQDYPEQKLQLQLESIPVAK